MAAPSALRTLELTAFKSYSEQRLPLGPLTLLVGRNGSGKSNALDALALLSLLADERDVSDLERGDQEVAGLRGGLTGAAPFGEREVKVGCTIDVDGGQLDFSLTLDSWEHPEVAGERLVLRRPNRPARTLLESKRQSAGAGISNALAYSGANPRGYQFLSSRLAVVQAVTKVPEDTQARRLVVSSCRKLIETLSSTVILDPVPAQMREYVRIGSVANRTGSTVSALVWDLKQDPIAWQSLFELVSGLLETQLREITFAEARLPDDRLVDVMVALVEVVGERTFTAPARLMSDGTLRYLAIVASLLHSRVSDKDSGSRRTLVVEEIENGLFPSQAARVLDLLRSEAQQQDLRLLATTHSPALLDAVRPEDHAGVMVCERTPEGQTQLRRLVDHPRYVEIAGGGAVGRAISAGELERQEKPRPKSLSDLFSAVS